MSNNSSKSGTGISNRSSKRPNSDHSDRENDKHKREEKTYSNNSYNQSSSCPPQSGHNHFRKKRQRLLAQEVEDLLPASKLATAVEVLRQLAENPALGNPKIYVKGSSDFIMRNELRYNNLTGKLSITDDFR